MRLKFIDIMNKAENKFNYWLNIIFKIASIAGIIILVWYTVETYKIRINTDNQLKLGMRPYVAFLEDPNPYTVINASNNVAQNIIQISKLNGQYYISREESVGGLSPNGKRHIDKNNFPDLDISSSTGS